MKRLTSLDLARIYDRDAEDMWPYALALGRVLERYAIESDLRQAHFLSQIGHESAGLRYTEEIWGPTEAQRGYEGREDLGNTEPGDGYRFRGRGLIQLTGRANYERYDKFLFERYEEDEHVPPDMVARPDLVGQPPYCLDVAGWYWHRYELNARADADDVEGVTKIINGGLNGLDERKELLSRAKVILEGHGVKLAPLPPRTLYSQEGSQEGSQEDLSEEDLSQKRSNRGHS